jgi:hypothetical protein
MAASRAKTDRATLRPAGMASSSARRATCHISEDYRSLSSTRPRRRLAREHSPRRRRRSRHRGLRAAAVQRGARARVVPASGRCCGLRAPGAGDRAVADGVRRHRGVVGGNVAANASAHSSATTRSTACCPPRTPQAAPVPGILDVSLYPQGADELSELISADLAMAGFSSRADPAVMQPSTASCSSTSPMPPRQRAGQPARNGLVRLRTRL